jgi:pyruvate/2-oxoglutarate/acetoin dehydrogenase E1 component
MFVEHRMLHNQKGHVPESEYTVPFGKARVLAQGSDVTLVGISYMAVECLRAQRHLHEAGISAEVIDPISLSPLDIHTIVESVRKTGRLIVVDAAWTSCGASAEIVARVAESLGGLVDLRLRRMGFEPVVCPTTKDLENLFYPNARKIASAAYSLVHNDKAYWMPASEDAPEIIEFKGPF